MPLLLLDLPDLDPVRNFALEARLGAELPPGARLLRFWTCAPCVAIGRFQKVEYEVRPETLAAGRLPVMRRGSGGGAVYLDPGCLLVTVIRPREAPIRSRIVREETRFLAGEIGRAVAPPGVDLSVDDRGGLFLPDGRKVAGTACALTRDRLLFHLSLLVATDLSALASALHPAPDYPERGAFVESRRSPVANLSEFAPLPMEEAKARIFARLSPALFRDAAFACGDARRLDSTLELAREFVPRG